MRVRDPQHFPSVKRFGHGNSDIEVIDSPPLTMRLGKLEADAYLLVCDKDLTEPEYERSGSDLPCRTSAWSCFE